MRALNIKVMFAAAIIGGIASVAAWRAANREDLAATMDHAIQGNATALVELRRLARDGNATAQYWVWTLMTKKWTDAPVHQTMYEKLVRLADFLDSDSSVKDAYLLLRQSANNGNAAARYDIAMIGLIRKAQTDSVAGTTFASGTSKSPEEQVSHLFAVNFMQDAAATGSPYAQYNLATAYLLGYGVAKDPAIAEKWLKRASYTGLEEAKRAYGFMLENGVGSPKNLDIAMQQYAEAKGDPLAALRLGTLALDRARTESDWNDARQFIKMANEELWPGASIALGAVKSQQARLIPETALSRLEDAAATGNPQGALMLGAIYRCGASAFKDDVEANYWFHVAANEGSARAKHELAMAFLEGLGTQSDKAISDTYSRRSQVKQFGIVERITQPLFVGEFLPRLRDMTEYTADGVERSAEQGNVLALNLMIARANSGIWEARSRLLEIFSKMGGGDEYADAINALSQQLVEAGELHADTRGVHIDDDALSRRLNDQSPWIVSKAGDRFTESTPELARWKNRSNTVLSDASNGDLSALDELRKEARRGRPEAQQDLIDLELRCIPSFGHYCPRRIKGAQYVADGLMWAFVANNGSAKGTQSYLNNLRQGAIYNKEPIPTFSVEELARAQDGARSVIQQFPASEHRTVEEIRACVLHTSGVSLGGT